MNTYSMAVAKKIILLVPSPVRGGQCLDSARHKGWGLPRAKSRGQFSKGIFFTMGLIICLVVSGWAENKSKTVKSEPVPIQNIAPQEQASPSAYEIDWTSINAGGDLNLSSTNYKVKVSTGQSVIGESQSTNYKMGIGFWYGVPAGPLCTSKPGDANGSGGNPNLSDIIYLVNYVFKGGPAPNPTCRGDANGLGGNANLSDIIYLVNYVFKGGPQPVKSAVCCL